MEQIKQKLVLQIKNKLFSANKNLVTAESCTGGYLAHLLTSVPSSSKFYKGGVVVYSEFAKSKILKIDEDIINNFGQVSKEVASLMAQNVLQQLNADFSLATTGYAGPIGGDKNNPCGTVYIGLSIKNRNTLVKKCFYDSKSRANIIHLSSTHALELLLESIQ